MNPKLTAALFQAFTIFYLLMLGFACGVIIALGAFSAPVIFRDAPIISQGAIDAFQAGMIMTEIFVRASYVLLFVAILIALYEILSATIHSNVASFLALSRLPQFYYLCYIIYLQLLQFKNKALIFWQTAILTRYINNQFGHFMPHSMHSLRFLQVDC